MPLFSADWVEKNIGTVDSLIRMRFARVPECYYYPAKNNVRKKIVEQAVKWFGKGTRVRLLLMPHVAAIDLFEFGQALKVVTAKSLMVENNHFYAEHLRSWIEASKTLSGWEMFKGLPLVEVDMSQATAEASGQYEVINLDFSCRWNSEVRNSLKNIFQRGLLAKPGILVLTLNQWEDRVRSNGKNHKPLRQVVPQRVQRLTRGTNYTCHSLWYMDWKSENGAEMVSFVFGTHGDKERQNKS